MHALHNNTHNMTSASPDLPQYISNNNATFADLESPVKRHVGGSILGHKAGSTLTTDRGYDFTSRELLNNK